MREEKVTSCAPLRCGRKQLSVTEQTERNRRERECSAMRVAQMPSLCHSCGRACVSNGALQSSLALCPTRVDERERALGLCWFVRETKRHREGEKSEGRAKARLSFSRSSSSNKAEQNRAAAEQINAPPTLSTVASLHSLLVLHSHTRSLQLECALEQRSSRLSLTSLSLVASSQPTAATTSARSNPPPRQTLAQAHKSQKRALSTSTRSTPHALLQPIVRR